MPQGSGRITYTTGKYGRNPLAKKSGMRAMGKGNYTVAPQGQGPEAAAEAVKERGRGMARRAAEEAGAYTKTGKNGAKTHRSSSAAMTE